MFSTLKPGNNVHVLEQTDKLTYKIGQVTEIKPNYQGGLDMKVKVDDKEYDFKLLPYNQSVANSSSVIVSDNKDNIVTELKKLKENSESILNNIEYYKRTAKDAEQLLRQMNPAYDKEIRRDEEVDALKQQMNNMQQTLANIEKLLTKKE